MSDYYRNADGELTHSKKKAYCVPYRSRCSTSIGGRARHILLLGVNNRFDIQGFFEKLNQ